ncbi:MAG: hypothetical protein HFE04_00250 [Bacilli bacterium]|nr:hypothetical protein [Bacilli bacterium]
MKNFEIFEVFPNVEKLKQFREEYIKTFKGSLVNKVISRSTKWYKYNEGVYTPSKIGLSTIPIASLNDLLNNDNKRDNSSIELLSDIFNFINYGASNVNQVKALKLKHDGDVEFYKPVNKFVYLLQEPQKRGVSYSTEVLSINEDLYNMIMIQFRNFVATTTPEDLSRYADFFSVSESPYAYISEEAISDFQRCGYFDQYDPDLIMKRLEISQKAVLSLRK